MKKNILLAIDNDLNALYHYNTKGSHWYVNGPGKRYQAHAQYAMGRANLDKLTSRLDSSGVKYLAHNLGSFGKDADHNILFVTGHSGSGKSTIAGKLKDKKVNVINLDLFTEQIGKDSYKERDAEFVNYLKKNNSDFYKFQDMKKYGIDFGTSEHGALLYRLEKSVEDFSKEQFKKGKHVVAEGVQIINGAMWPEKNYFKDKPVVIARTNALKSFYRAGLRDEKLNFRDLMPEDIKYYVKFYNDISKQLKELKKEFL